MKVVLGQELFANLKSRANWHGTARVDQHGVVVNRQAIAEMEIPITGQQVDASTASAEIVQATIDSARVKLAGGMNANRSRGYAGEGNQLSVLTAQLRIEKRTGEDRIAASGDEKVAPVVAVAEGEPMAGDRVLVAQPDPGPDPDQAAQSARGNERYSRVQAVHP